jgi:hypothetical protein
MTTEVKKGIIAICLALVLGLALLGARWLWGADKKAATDIEAVRAELREQVANGELTEAEAQVRFAEAFAKSKQQERDKERPKLAPELEAFGAELKEKMERGDLTEEEAKAKWMAAAQKVGAEGNAKSKAGVSETKKSRGAQGENQQTEEP